MTAKFRKPHQQFVINEDGRQKLLDLDTTPIRELLAIMLSAMPSLDELKYWAARHPDRWAQSFMNISRCAGIITKEPTPPQGNITVVNLHMKSDSEVHAMMAETAKQLKALGVRLPELEHVEAERLPVTIDQKEAVNAE